ncbi:MAG: zinc ribbon domain-containing protein [Fimbriimonadaceae bacterium]|nr:zinc ribbon domain-containing protein [Fimbriimonadaceae bacterium]
MTCAKCGAQNLENAKFCDRCGAKLETPPPPAPAPTEPAKRFCSACGTPLKPAAKFCGSCGAPQQGAAAPQEPARQTAAAPSPTPQAAPAPPAAAAPRPAPAFQTQAPPPSAYRPPAPAGPSHPPSARPKGKGCRTGCIVLVVLLALLAVGAYYVWNNVVLSNPAALVGTWKVEGGKSDLTTEKFSFEAADGGAKLVQDGPEKLPFDIVLKPEGGRVFKARVTNPADKSKWVDITAELEGFTTLKLKAEMPDGTTEEAEATRVLGSDN